MNLFGYFLSLYGQQENHPGFELRYNSIVKYIGDIREDLKLREEREQYIPIALIRHNEKLGVLDSIFAVLTEDSGLSDKIEILSEDGLKDGFMSELLIVDKLLSDTCGRDEKRWKLLQKLPYENFNVTAGELVERYSQLPALLKKKSKEYREMGYLNAATNVEEKLIDLLERYEPNLNVTKKLAEAHYSAGKMYWSMDYEKSIEHMESARELFQKLHDLGDYSYVELIANSHKWISTAYKNIGDYLNAKESKLNEISFLENNDGKINGLKYNCMLINSYRDMADLLYRHGESDRVYFEKIIGCGDQLIHYEERGGEIIANGAIVELIRNDDEKSRWFFHVLTDYEIALYRLGDEHHKVITDLLQELHQSNTMPRGVQKCVNTALQNLSVSGMVCAES